mmetsp:Transcript_10623/g.21923  ORF Transcript_10623/g.21923 Transcript_10623/m.21923 type:complete len:449 (-) Transcript_10623:132-1478(-)
MILVWSDEGGPLQYLGLALFILQFVLPPLVNNSLQLEYQLQFDLPLGILSFLLLFIGLAAWTAWYCFRSWQANPLVAPVHGEATRNENDGSGNRVDGSENANNDGSNSTTNTTTTTNNNNENNNQYVNNNNADNHQIKNDSHGHQSDLTSSTLGDKLADALSKTRKLLSQLETRRNATTNKKYNGTVNDHGHHDDEMVSSNSVKESECDDDDDDDNSNHAVLFLGMDSPELPLGEIVRGLQLSRGGKYLVREHKYPMPQPQTQQPTPQSQPRQRHAHTGKAHLCPANDGGYALLSLPPSAPPSRIFSNVRWSHPLTAVSQLKALTDAGVDVSIGRLMHDVDEAEDVRDLAGRLSVFRRRGGRGSGKVDGGDVVGRDGNGGNGEGVEVEDGLTTFSSGVDETLFPNASSWGGMCPYTWKALVELGVVVSTPSDDLAKTMVVNDCLFDNK